MAAYETCVTVTAIGTGRGGMGPDMVLADQDHHPVAHMPSSVHGV